LSSSYPDVSRAHSALTAGLTETEQDAVFRQNAAAWYFAELQLAMNEKQQGQTEGI
jgi:hypothetical protein